MRIAVLGLGEAGGIYARDLAAAGATVTGYDPSRRRDDVDQRDDTASAVRGADAVLSLVSAASALQAAREALPHLSTHTVYADLNTASPDLKREVAALAAARGIAMADVAVLAPVPRARLRTPLLASGPGATAFARALEPWGAPVTTVPGEAGEAARLKLLRSVFMKGLGALVIEALGAARAAGAEAWLHAQIADEFGADGAAFVDHLVAGTHRHAARREQEVRDALTLLEADGLPADMTRGAAAWFARIVAGDG